jgi:hypothetical protein
MKSLPALLLSILFILLCALHADAQEGKKKGKGGGPFGGGFRTDPPMTFEDSRGPAFSVSLVEATKERKILLPYLPEYVNRRLGMGGGPAAGLPNAGEALGPYVATIRAFRHNQTDEPERCYFFLSLSVSSEFSEEDLRKIVQFKKDFAKKLGPKSEAAETAILTLQSHGLRLMFDLKTGECRTSQLQIPDGFFDALSDALADLEKLKATKPAFQVK